jgi:hypothetical protein
MHCACEELPVYTYYHADHGLSQKLRPFIVSVAKSGWRELFRCEICGTHWRIDVEDKFQQQFVWKVGAFREEWASIEHVNEEKELLLQRRGGETEEKCVWAECTKRKVKGMALCIDHLYATGARK